MKPVVIHNQTLRHRQSQPLSLACALALKAHPFAQRNWTGKTAHDRDRSRCIFQYESPFVWIEPADYPLELNLIINMVACARSAIKLRDIGYHIGRERHRLACAWASPAARRKEQA